MYIFAASSWKKVARNSWCPKNVIGRWEGKKSQEACQALCEASGRSNCVGIVYSHTAKNKICYLCKHGALAYSGNGEVFYSRPGIF